MTPEELGKTLSRMGFTLSEEVLKSYEIYAALLKEWNGKFNLTAIEETEEIYEKHFLDCLIPLTLTKVKGRVCDVGSGAGFPGLVWAIADPSLSLTLIEPTGKRCTFLHEVKRMLHLSNTEILNRRAEECSDLRESFDVAAARAVANLPLLSELCVPLVKQGGSFVSMKGAKGEEELAEAGFALKKLGCTESELIRYALLNKDARTLIVAKKTEHTPGKYPRNYGQMKKSPLKAK